MSSVLESRWWISLSEFRLAPCFLFGLKWPREVSSDPTSSILNLLAGFRSDSALFEQAFERSTKGFRNCPSCRIPCSAADFRETLISASGSRRRRAAQARNIGSLQSPGTGPRAHPVRPAYRCVHADIERKIPHIQPGRCRGADL